jgi:hypothetical protein
VDYFELQAWHVVALFGAVLLGIFKEDLSQLYQGILMVWHKPFAMGQTVELLNPSGTWESVEIVHYNLAIPFVRSGGVIVKHIDAEGVVHMEKLSYGKWGAQRVRVRKEPRTPMG